MNEDAPDAPITGVPPGLGLTPAAGSGGRIPAATEVTGWPSERAMRRIEQTPLPANVGSLLAQAAAETPDRTALVFFDDDVSFSYAALDREVDRTANALVRAGIGFGSHVSVMVPTEATYPLTWLALARIGAVAQPLNYTYTSHELGYMLADSEAEFLVIAADLLPVFEALQGAPFRLSASS